MVMVDEYTQSLLDTIRVHEATIKNQTETIVMLSDQVRGLQQYNDQLVTENTRIKDVGYPAYLTEQVERYKRLWRNARLRLADALEHIRLSEDTQDVLVSDYVNRTTPDHEYSNP